jgi:CRP/FNR family transcriptional regulator
MNSHLDYVNGIGLTPAFIEKHQFHIETVDFSAGSVLFKPNDSCHLFLILLSGSIRVELTSRNGRLITLYRMSSGESCILTTSALLNDEQYYAQGIAESDITALAIPAEDFHRMVEIAPDFSRFVLRDYAKRVTSIISLIDKMASRDVLADVGQYLLDHQKNNEITTTQADIAMDIGSAREVVSRKLAILESKSFIKRERGKIIILQRDALEQWLDV